MPYEHPKELETRYYDDWNQDKNYVRVLYNPGVAVQARELTQGQTYQTNQIANLADSLYKNGVTTTGARITVKYNQPYITAVSGTPSNMITSMVGMTIVGNTSMQTAEVVATNVDTREIFIKYHGSSFVDGEAFTTQEAPFYQFTSEAGSSGFAIAASCTKGIVYLDGFFINVAEQGVIVTTKSTGRFTIGYAVTRNIVTSSDDSTLLDNANGSYNVNAPGANRYQIQLVLSSYEDGLDEVPEDFIPGIVIEDQKIIQNQSDDKYSDLMDMLAKRTYDQSGNYTVNAWKVALFDDESDTTRLRAEISPGLGYIHGYAVETLISQNVYINKPRETGFSQTQSIYIDDSLYTIAASDIVNGVVSSNGMFDATRHEQVDVMTGEDGTGTSLGKCRITGYIRSGNELFIYLSDMSQVLNLFTSAKSLRGADGTTFVNLKQSSAGLAFLYGQQKPLLYDTGYNQVATIAQNSIGYDFVKNYKNIQSSGGVLTITESDSNINFYGLDGVLFVKELTTDVIVPIGALNVVPNNVSNPPSLSISNLPVAAGTYEFVLKVKRKNGNARQKTLQTKTVSITVPGTDNTFLFADEDVLDIVSIKQTSNLASGESPDEELASEVSVFTGQTDFYYDKGGVTSLRNIIGKRQDQTDAASTTYTVTYRYFNHIGSGAFTVDSYTTTSNKLQVPNIYEIIPSYRMSSGVIINLRDYVDFRVKLSSLTNGTEIASYRSFVECDVYYYLPRVDLIYVDKEGEFGVVYGIPSLRPERPVDRANSMTIYEITHKAYVNTRADSSLSQLKTDRYTMSDIAKLDSRITRVEEAVTLSMLEQSAENMKITDENGFDRFKNGLMADAFTSYDRADYTNEEFRACIDGLELSGRCTFGEYYFDFEINNTSTSNVTVSTDTKNVTIPYTTKLYATNPQASNSVNVQQYLFYTWNGVCNLNPAVDNWVYDLGNILVSETHVNVTRTPIVYNAHKAGARKYRANTWVQSWVETYDKLVAREYQWEYLRIRDVGFSLSGMRQGMRVTATFDGVPIALSNNLVDAKGNLTGTFRVPENQTVGRKLIVFTDVENTSSASNYYTGYGKTIWRDVYRTHYHITQNYTEWYKPDPVAQQMFINSSGGLYLDSIGVFFATKDPAMDVTCWIVENENGYPSSNIIGKRTLKPEDVKIGVNNETLFKFDYPVYLQDGLDYSFIILTDSRLYKIYYAALGETSLIDGKGIADQPYLGSMFMSQNTTTWDAKQAWTIKFNAYSCVFDTSVTSELVLKNVEHEGDDIEVADITPTSNVFELPDTEIHHFYRWKGTSTWTEFSPMDGVSNNTLQTISEEDNNLVGRSIEYKITMKTNNKNVSPMVALEECYGIATWNEVIETGEEDFMYNAGVWITNPVTMANASDDLTVLVDVIRPGASDIEVYFRTTDYKPSYVETSITGTFGVSEDSIKSLTGKEVAVYYKTKSSDAVTFQGRCFVSGYDNTEVGIRKLFVNQVQDVTMFKDTVDGDVPEYIGANTVEHIFLIDVINGTALTSIKTYVRNTESYTKGQFVFYNQTLWVATKDIAQSPTMPIPSTMGSDWQLVPAIRTISSIKEYTDISWRKMNKVEQSYVAGTDFENQFVEVKYVPEISLESEFKVFAVRIDMQARNKVNVPRIKNLRAIATY